MEIAKHLAALEKELDDIFGRDFTKTILADARRKAGFEEDEELTEEMFKVFIKSIYADKRVEKMLGTTGVKTKVDKWETLWAKEEAEEKIEALEEKNKQLLAINKRLQELDKLKSDFIVTVSHELRTPLTSVRGFSLITKKRLEKTIFPEIKGTSSNVIKAVNQVKGNMDVIISESERLTKIVNDIIDLAEMESGRASWAFKQISIKEVLEEAVKAVNPLLAKKGLKLLKEIEEDLPPVEGDKDKLIKAVVNLLVNAIKFTNDGLITCRAQKEGSNNLIMIEDTGIGIAEEYQDKVFESFRQIGDVLTEKPQGNGLGLPLCKNIIAYHGGRIWLESKTGQGSRFYFTLPLKNK